MLTIKLIHCIKTTILSKVSILPCAASGNVCLRLLIQVSLLRQKKINENEDSCREPVNSGQAWSLDIKQLAFSSSSSVLRVQKPVEQVFFCGFFPLQFVDLTYKKQLSWPVETSEQTLKRLKSVLLFPYIISILHP